MHMARWIVYDVAIYSPSLPWNILIDQHSANLRWRAHVCHLPLCQWPHSVNHWRCLWWASSGRLGSSYTCQASLDADDGTMQVFLNSWPNVVQERSAYLLKCVNLTHTLPSEAIRRRAALLHIPGSPQHHLQSFWQWLPSDECSLFLISHAYADYNNTWLGSIAKLSLPPMMETKQLHCSSQLHATADC